MLGCKQTRSTTVYINLEAAAFSCKSDEFHVKTAKTVEKACKLVEVGFEYITEMEGIKIFRKRK